MAWVEGNDLLEKYITFSILPSTEFTNKIDCACPFLFPNVSTKSNKKPVKLFFLSFAISLVQSCVKSDLQCGFFWYRRSENCDL
jgi:hypothetical protein